MATEQEPANEPASESAGRRQPERTLGGLLDQLQTPLKQMQEWVNGGQLQSVVGELQKKAERAQEQVERRLQALDEVRQGLQVHVKKQLEELKQEGRTGQTKAPRRPQSKKRTGKKRTPPK